MDERVEFDSSGKTYRAGRLSAFQQLHVSRRIAPLLPPLIPVFMQIAGSLQGGGNAMAVLGRTELLQPFTDSLAQLPDDAAEYVVATCLSVVQRQQETGWAPVWNAGAKRAMFDDLNDIGALLPIVVRVIQENLGTFTAALRISQPTQADQKSP